MSEGDFKKQIPPEGDLLLLEAGEASLDAKKTGKDKSSDVGIVKTEVLDLSGEKLLSGELTLRGDEYSANLATKNKPPITEIIEPSDASKRIVIDMVAKEGLEIIKDAEFRVVGNSQQQLEPGYEFIPLPAENWWDAPVEEKPKGPSTAQKFLNLLRRGGELGKELIEKAKPKVEKVMGSARDIAEEVIAVGGGMAIRGGSALKAKLQEKSVELGQFLKDSGIALKTEIGSNLESGVALAVDALGRISNSDIVQGAVDRISIFKNSMAEVWVGSGVDEFNSYIKEQEVKAFVIEESLEFRKKDLVNLEKISQDVGFEVSASAKEKLLTDIAKKETELKSENDRIETMKAENSFYDIRRTGYLAKIEGSKRNIADRIQVKVDINSEHSSELQASLDLLAKNKEEILEELGRLRSGFVSSNKITKETDSPGARRSAVSLMRQISARINKLEEEELIACNEDEGRILKRKAKIDAKLEGNEEQLSDLGVEPRKKQKKDKEPIDGYVGTSEKSEEKPVYFEDSLSGDMQEKSAPRPEKKELEVKFSLEDFLKIWNKEYQGEGDFYLEIREYKTTRSTKRNQKDMNVAILSLMQNQHPFSYKSSKLIKILIDNIYKTK